MSKRKSTNKSQRKNSKSECVRVEKDERVKEFKTIRV